MVNLIKVFTLDIRGRFVQTKPSVSVYALDSEHVRMTSIFGNAKIRPVFDASNMSDEYYGSIREERFTGAFVGLCCQDLTGRSLQADFDYVEYIERKE